VREGGCLCGELRFKTSDGPRRTVVCHCTFCQRLTGSAFAVWPVFAEADVSMSGDAQRYEHRSDESGRWIHLFFCQRCGTTVYSRWQEDKGELALLGGTFDETGWIGVDRHVWTRSRQRWVEIPAGHAQFAMSSRT
jgi:hypothetical protein